LVTDNHSNFYFIRITAQLTDLDESVNLVIKLHVHSGPLLVAEVVRGKKAVVADEDPAVGVHKRRE
jgi:hypothetical protein